MNINKNISLDRAKSIADAAVDAGLASWDAARDGALVLGAPLKAKMEELGVKGLLGLDQRQALAVEAFIA